MLMANVVVLQLIHYINQQNNYELENTVLKMQLAQQEEHIRQREKNDIEIRALRHDMKRYFITYQQLLEEGKVEVVKRDIEKVLGEKLVIEEHAHTKNSIINSVINEKIGRCKESGICCQIHVESQIEIEAEVMELGIMLSNLFDNAIEAEEKG